MLTSELVTYFSQSLLSITVAIPESLKVEWSDQSEDGPFFVPVRKCFFLLYGALVWGFWRGGSEGILGK